MTEVHVAHDCQVGNHTIFANAATLAGHVEVEDWALDRRLLGRAPVLPRGGPRLHGRLHGGHQGRAARTRRRWGTGRASTGVNTRRASRRRGFTREPIAAIREAYRVLLQSRLNTTEALGPPRGRRPLAARGAHPRRVHPRSSERGVILKRRRPALRSRGAVARRRSRAGDAWGPSGADRGQRPLPLPGRRGGPTGRPARGGGGDPRGGRARARRRRWTRSTGSASASSAAASRRCRRRGGPRGGHGRTGEAPPDLLGHRPRPEAARRSWPASRSRTRTA